MSTNQVAYAQKRRSSRIEKVIPLVVQGVGAFRAPYREQVTTLTISCHGCTYHMKEEVVPGDMVLLNIGRPGNGHIECSSRARVKWVQKLQNAKDQVLVVAVELEIAGNIWGIGQPPQDWFPVQEVRGIEPANSKRELRVVTRTEPQIAPTPSEGAQPVPQLKKDGTTASLSSSFSEVIACLSDQVQVMVSETAAAVLAKEKNQLLEEFRLQLKDEATRTRERVIADSEKELARRALKELNEVQAAARANHERWIKSFEQDIETAKQRIINQGTEVSQRIEGMAVSTIERVQRSLEASRSESVDHFVSRLRDRVAPTLEEAKIALQKLAASQSNLREESQAICSRFADQLETSANARMSKVLDDLDKHSTAVTDEGNEKLRELLQDCQKAAQEHLRSLVRSATDYTRKTLEKRAEETSRHFATQLEGYTRSYLESISESIAEISKKTAIQSHG